MKGVWKASACCLFRSLISCSAASLERSLVVIFGESLYRRHKRREKSVVASSASSSLKRTKCFARWQSENVWDL